MKATELRIGNLVQDKKNKSPWRIECFLGSTMATVDAGLVTFPTDDNHDIELSEHEGIPLTEDWLLNMGFDKAINGWFCSKEYLWLMQNKLNNQWFANVNGIGNIDCKRIDYVHSLQNLYFALTGEELTFSITKTS